MGEEGQVSLAGNDRDRGARDVAMQELAVPGWSGGVGRTLPDLHGKMDLLEGESPGVSEDPVVLDAAGGALAHGSRTNESANSGGPHSEMTLRSTGGNERITARRSRVLLVLMMLTFMMVEASHGACRLKNKKARSSGVRPRVVP